MALAPRAVIFDHSTLLVDDQMATAELAGVLTDIKGRGIPLVVFSTHPQDVNAKLAARGLPPCDLLVTKQQVGMAKGSPVWIQFAGQQLKLPAHQFFYVGDDAQDWRTAINSGVMYVHAKWVRDLPAGVTAIPVTTPESAYRFMTHLFLPPARWGYTLDVPGDGLHVRCLLNATTSLACDPPHGTFDLKDIYHRGLTRTVGRVNARDLLGLHALANLYAEGLIDSGTRFAIYPKSTPGRSADLFVQFLDPAAKFFHGWLKEAALTRATKAPDTSDLRAKQRHKEVTFTKQANTVVVGEGVAAHVRGRRLIVFDDFSTTGMSLDWARLLLLAAGAERVILVAMGKFAVTNINHNCHCPVGVEVRPHHATDYSEAQFRATSHRMVEGKENMRVTREMFRRWVEKARYEGGS